MCVRAFANAPEPAIYTLLDGSLTSCSLRIASIFCEFFTNIARRAKQKSILLNNFVWSSPIVPHPKTYSTFHFKEVLVTDVFKHLKKLSRNKATGHDDLPPGMLKDSARFIAALLAHVINVCRLNLQSYLKTLNISPVFKSGSKSDLDNYRPVSVLPICSKIFEKCIHSQIIHFLEEKNMLSATQFGFRKKRNTETAATLFLDQIRQNMDSGQMTGAIFIDLSKAFDTLSHAQIIKNLPCYGIRGKEKDLFVNYLFNRKQAVHFGSDLSKPHNVTCGVPQGSILGPLLFLCLPLMISNQFLITRKSSRMQTIPSSTYLENR